MTAWNSSAYNLSNFGLGLRIRLNSACCAASFDSGSRTGKNDRE